MLQRSVSAAGDLERDGGHALRLNLAGAQTDGLVEAKRRTPRTRAPRTQPATSDGKGGSRTVPDTFYTVVLTASPVPSAFHFRVGARSSNQRIEWASAGVVGG